MNDLEWLTQQQPPVDEDPAARARARRALRDHARPPLPKHRRAAPRRAGFVAVAALFAAAMAIAWPTDRTPTPAPIPAPEVAEAAPLVLLSEKIAAEPEPKGDATLVIRTQNYPDGKSIPGHDLYLDDGRYYYGATKDALKGAALNSRYHEPLVKAAAAASTLAPAQARRGMMEGLADGNKLPKVDRSTEDNWVWTGSMDALLAGAGRKDVRAGVMMLLDTLDAVTVTEDGKLLKLTNTDFGGGYVENLYVDAETGIPQKFVGGEAGEEPSVVVDYDIKRVTAANWADAAA